MTVSEFLTSPLGALILDAGHYIVLPLGYWLFHRSKALMKEYVTTSVAESFARRAPEMKQMMDDANDVLLQKINGTYVRSKEQAIRDANVNGRIERVEAQLDRIIGQR